MKISGYVCIRNGIELDYCYMQAIESLLPVCDEVVVSDGESTDGTRDVLDYWAEREPKLRIVTYPWPNPHGDKDYWIKWLNHTRKQLKYPMQLTVDADEILDPLSYPVVIAAAAEKKCLWFERLNFWRDAQHMCPRGHMVGSEVVRLAPTDLWMCSDEPHFEGEPEIRLRAGWPPDVDRTRRIFHYGFIRHNYIKKARVVLGIAAGTMDERFEQSEAAGTPWEDHFTFEEPQGDKIVRAPVLEFNEQHPDLIHEWLRDRGHNPTP